MASLLVELDEGILEILAVVGKDLTHFTQVFAVPTNTCLLTSTFPSTMTLQGMAPQLPGNLSRTGTVLIIPRVVGNAWSSVEGTKIYLMKMLQMV